MGKFNPPDGFRGRLIRVSPDEELPSSFRQRYASQAEAGEERTVLVSLEHLRQEIQSLREQVSRLQPEAAQQPQTARDVVTREELDLLFSGADSGEDKGQGETMDSVSLAGIEDGEPFSSLQEDGEFETFTPQENPFLQAGYGGEGFPAGQEKRGAWWEKVQRGDGAEEQSLNGDEGDAPWLD